MEALVSAVFLLVCVLLLIILVLLNKIDRMQAVISRIEYVLFQLKQNIAFPPAPPLPPSGQNNVIAEKAVQSARPVYKAVLLQTVPPKTTTNSVWSRLWNWLTVGEEFRPQNIAPEYAVATTWLIRCGVIFLVIGAGFLLKYSFDKNLFSPALRVGGVAFLGICAAIGGHCFAKNKYRRLGVTISGGGFALLLFSLLAAHNFYGMIGTKTTIITAIPVVAAAIAASLHRNTPITIWIGGIGGYIAPWILNEKIAEPSLLICYFTLVNAGILFVAWLKKWPSLRCLSAVGYAYCSIGMMLTYEANILTLNYSLPFFAINYILCTLPFWHNAAVEKFEYFIWGCANGLFFLFAFPKACQEGSEILASITAAFAVTVNLLVFWICRDRKSKGVFIIFAAIALVFALEFGVGKYFWHSAVFSATALLLSIIAMRCYFRVFMLCSLGIFAYTALTFSDMENAVYWLELRNNMLSYGVFAIALMLAAFCVKKSLDYKNQTRKAVIANSMLVASGAVMFIYLTCETYELLGYFQPSFRLGGISVLWSIFAVTLTLLGIKSNYPRLRHLGILLFALTCFKVLLVDLSGLDSLYRIIALGVVGMLMIAAAIFYIYKKDQFKLKN